MSKISKIPQKYIAGLASTVIFLIGFYFLPASAQSAPLIGTIKTSQAQANASPLLTVMPASTFKTTVTSLNQQTLQTLDQSVDAIEKTGPTLPAKLPDISKNSPSSSSGNIQAPATAPTSTPGSTSGSTSAATPSTNSSATSTSQQSYTGFQNQSNTNTNNSTSSGWTNKIQY